MRPNVSSSPRISLSALSRSRKGPLVGSLPSMMFLTTERPSTRVKNWWIMPMPRPIASLGESMETPSPSTRISPSSIL